MKATLRAVQTGLVLPTDALQVEVVKRNSLWVTDLEFLRVHYATTLAHWTDRFEANRDKVIALYDERLARIWEFYRATPRHCSRLHYRQAA